MQNSCAYGNNGAAGTFAGGAQWRLNFPAGGLALIVEDDPVVSALFTAFFKNIGQPCAVARNAAEGSVVLFNSFDSVSCIILDLLMPGSDGFELLTHLKEASFVHPIFICSGAPEETVQKAVAYVQANGLNWGGNIRKPVTREELCGKLLKPALRLGTGLEAPASETQSQLRQLSEAKPVEGVSESTLASSCLSFLPHRVAALDEHYNYLISNPANSHFYNHQPQELIGLNGRQFIGNLRWERRERYFYEAALSGRHVEYNIVVNTPAGVRQPYAVTMDPLRDGIASVQGVVVTMSELAMADAVNKTFVPLKFHPS